MKREQLCKVLKTRKFIYKDEIDAFFADIEYFQASLSNSLTQCAKTGAILAGTIDRTATIPLPTGQKKYKQCCRR